MKKLSTILLALALLLTLTGAVYAVQHQGHGDHGGMACSKDGCCKADCGKKDEANKDAGCCKDGACCKDGKCGKDGAACTKDGCKNCGKDGCKDCKKDCCKKQK